MNVKPIDLANYPCDVCGERATTFFREAIPTEPVRGELIVVVPGPIEARCDEHAVEGKVTP